MTKDEIFELYKKDYPCEEYELDCERHDCSECEYYREVIFEEHYEEYLDELREENRI